ncbi:glycosyltransferase [Brucella gallinifaecis]|uniref:glycosyltransferase n=1 Tax=Brucella gallinifaecis TaxID=215590 RepID=UPI0030812FBA
MTLTMIGDGVEKQHFVKLTDSLNLADQIRFLAGMAAREAFSLGRNMVLPLRAEALPYIVLKPLAAGRTVIARDDGGILETFSLHSPALTRPYVDYLKEKLLLVIKDENGFQAFVPAASRLHERFSRSAIAKSKELIYREERC